MPRENNELKRERQTIEIMIQMYCRDKHGRRDGLCEECTEISDYANERLNKCQFGEDKPTCSNCTVHCYKPSMRTRVLEVMKHSGPKMILSHPLLAIKHLKDGKRKILEES